MPLSVATWNVEWAAPNSLRTAEILRRIDRHAPEVVCLTETDVGLLSKKGHTICSQPDYGYTIKEERRKVLLWSREPWDQVDDVGSASMPLGRFVSRRHTDVNGRGHCYRDLYSLVRITD